MKKQISLAVFFSLSMNCWSHDFALREEKVKIGKNDVLAYSLVGKILYTFEHDSKGKKSNCTGKCAEIWPPILLTPEEVTELISHNGEIDVYTLASGDIDKEGFSVIKRGLKGELSQLAFNGMPLYYYAYDRSNDDAYGDEHNPAGVDGWYAFTSTFSSHE